MLNPFSVVWKAAMKAKDSVDKFNFRVGGLVSYSATSFLAVHCKGKLCTVNNLSKIILFREMEPSWGALW